MGGVTSSVAADDDSVRLWAELSWVGFGLGIGTSNLLFSWLRACWRNKKKVR